MTRAWFVVALGACSVPPPPASGSPTGVVFTYPVDHQLDVPLGARIVVSFFEPVGEVGDIELVGPTGAVAVSANLANDFKTVTLTSEALEPGVTYQVSVATAPVFEFTTRDDRPKSGAPRLIAIDGSDPAQPGAFRPIVDTSTIELVFSEPLDPRSVEVGPGAIELVDATTNVAVPARLLAGGIHASLDPIAPLVANGSYELRLGARLHDSSGEAFAATAVPFAPLDSLGRGGNVMTLRTREAGDALPALSRLDVYNAIELAHPLIGAVSSTMKPGVLAAELGDPSALGGPIAFTIPRGQRLEASALEILLAGTIPSGLATGDIQIELVSDCNGRLYRNRYQAADVLPDNDASPLYVDLSLDLGVFATDPVGNAVLAQTVLGVQVSGLAMADNGKLAIEVLGTMDFDLLGVANAPTNLVLDLVTDPSVQAAHDDVAPELVTSLPDAGSHDLAADAGIELVFSEPIDADLARAGGIVLEDAADREVPAAIELRGSVVVLRPRALLTDGAQLRVLLRNVADVAGNAMATRDFTVATPVVVATDAPLSVLSATPGTACALVDSQTGAPGRCSGGQPGDDHYHPFSLDANDRIEVVFDQEVDPRSLTLGTACGNGSVRVENLAPDGRCLSAVKGSLIPRQRGLAFVPDAPWTASNYRLLLASGPDTTCNPGEVCGANGHPASFDPLAGKTATASGGPDLMIDFVGAAQSTGTRLVAGAAPFSDLNASGRIESGEQPRDDNRAALRIAATSGLITSATFSGPDCIPSTPGHEACMYMLGTMPAEIGRAMQDCTLPDGTTAASCIPVTFTAQQLYATSVAMNAAALGIPIATETGLSVMRMREPAGGPPRGFIVDRDGTPTLLVALDLYMDAPDMAVPLATHDLHSKSLSVLLSGPVTFRPDGRIAIALRNTKDLAITVGINAPLGITGSVALVVPANEMKLQLLSPPLRGSLR